MTVTFVCAEGSNKKPKAGLLYAWGLSLRLLMGNVATPVDGGRMKALRTDEWGHFTRSLRVRTVPSVSVSRTILMPGRRALWRRPSVVK